MPQSAGKTGVLAHVETAAAAGLLPHHMHREGVTRFVDMSNHQNQLELILNGGNRLDQFVTATVVLRAKAFVDEQRPKLRPSPTRQHLREGHANSEVDAEGLAA